MMCPNPQCGKEIHDHSSYCKYCHTKVLPVIDRSGHVSAFKILLMPIVSLIVIASIGLLVVSAIKGGTRVYHTVPTANATRKPQPTYTPRPSPYYTARDIQIIEKPYSYSIGKWQDVSYEGDLHMNGKVYKNAIGMYINHSEIPSGQEGGTQIIYAIGDECKKFICIVGAEDQWDYGPSSEYGTYRVSFYGDNSGLLYSTDWHDYQFVDHVNIDISKDDVLTIILNETKGSEGTLNIILGDIEMYGE